MLRSHRAAAADPYARDVRADHALVVRLGYGEGEQVADGRFGRAVELPREPPKRKRGEALAPQERLAAVLGGRDSLLVGEELLLRARLDLDAGPPARGGAAGARSRSRRCSASWTRSSPRRCARCASRSPARRTRRSTATSRRRTRPPWRTPWSRWRPPRAAAGRPPAPPSALHRFFTHMSNGGGEIWAQWAEGSRPEGGEAIRMRATVVPMTRRARPRSAHAARDRGAPTARPADRPRLAERPRGRRRRPALRASEP